MVLMKFKDMPPAKQRFILSLLRDIRETAEGVNEHLNNLNNLLPNEVTDNDRD
jgi:hypothetical protein